ncbi:hypothetical protein O2K51_08035 [Apibacter raozihei]|uniref:LOG family protein n=1 Tax=Apibacter raozihei TaxID=2500547 RepID=UPI000FE2B36B|nr:hypothetical protein [Apibacter raozihei]
MSIKRFKNFIKSESEFKSYISKSIYFKDIVVQNINFVNFPVDWKIYTFKNTIFINCELPQEDFVFLVMQGVFVYPKFKSLPYKPARRSLYTWKELMAKEDGETLTCDEKIYIHFNTTRFNPPMDDALAQRIHDYSIDSSLRELLLFDDEGMTEKKAVGFMGGHSMDRTSEFYIKTAKAARLLAESGYYIVTGGGPGIMEAANFGAYMANYTEADFYKALAILSDVKKTNPEQPEYLAENYLEQALRVLELYPEGNGNLAIPTWFYGHEPSNVFASHIAKYFSNSIREDILLAVCLYGVVYAPGSAGTTQEIFQEATQNHYGTYGYYSPMVFFGKKRYVEDTSLYSTLHQLAKGMEYKNLLFLTDHPEEVLEYIKAHPPKKK